MEYEFLLVSYFKDCNHFYLLLNHTFNKCILLVQTCATLRIQSILLNPCIDDENMLFLFRILFIYIFITCNLLISCNRGFLYLLRFLFTCCIPSVIFQRDRKLLICYIYQRTRRYVMTSHADTALPHAMIHFHILYCQSYNKTYKCI